MAMPPPVPLAMIICDAIWVDPATNKRFLLGLFSELGARSFPVTHPLMAVHVELTDALGKLKVKLQLVDVDAQRTPIGQVEADIEVPDPRAVVGLDLHIRNATFPEAGEYRLQLFAGDEFLMERRMHVRRVP